MDILVQLAKDARKNSNGDCEAAKKKIIKKLKADKNLFKKICWPLVYLAVSEAVELEMRNSRQEYWADGSENPNNEPGAGLMAGISAIASGDLYFYPLRNGKLLGEAIKEDVTTEKKWFRSYTIANMNRYRWFAAIEKELGNNPTVEVKTAVSREKLAELLAAAKMGGEHAWTD